MALNLACMKDVEYQLHCFFLPEIKAQTQQTEKVQVKKYVAIGCTYRLSQCLKRIKIRFPTYLQLHI